MYGDVRHAIHSREWDLLFKLNDAIQVVKLTERVPIWRNVAGLILAYMRSSTC
jgi:hypothetical protein